VASHAHRASPAPSFPPGDEEGGPARSIRTHALADDDTTLDPTHPINANLKDGGIGLVPGVVGKNAPHKTALLASPAIRAQMAVPFGWHVIDDGRRALIFDPRGHVQINLNLLPRERRDESAILGAFEDEARASYSRPEFVRQERGGRSCLGVRRIADGGQELEQFHLLATGPDDGSVLHARVTSVPARSADACALTELILSTVDFEHRTEPAPKPFDSVGNPGWWHRSRKLEAEGKFDEAEEAIRHGVDHIGAAASVAQMYAERMVRLKEAGDMAGALNAFKESDGWIAFYASMATSGGEGVALSYERDRFRAGLVRMLGFDPKAGAMGSDR